MRFDGAIVNRNTPIAIGKNAVLPDAVVARSACAKAAHVPDTSSGLELHNIGDQLKGLDDHGRGGRSPHSAGSK